MTDPICLVCEELVTENQARIPDNDGKRSGFSHWPACEQPGSGEMIQAASVAAFIEALPNGKVVGWQAGVSLPPGHRDCACPCCSYHRQDRLDQEDPGDTPDPDVEAVPCRLDFVVHVRAIREGKVF